MNSRVLRLRGLMLEKLVERAEREGACFELIERVGPREIRVRAEPRNAKALEALAARFGVRCAREGRTLRSRVSLPLCLVACALLTSSALSRVWVIDIRAPEASRSAIYEALGRLGAVPGARADALDTGALSLSVQGMVDGLSFVGVRVRGVRLSVEAVAENGAPGAYDISAARDIVASRDGVIARVDAFAGAAMIAPGDVVRRGQTLIRGQERAAGGAFAPVAAKGEVLARVWFAAECALPLAEERYERTGVSSARARLALFGWEIALSDAAEYASFDAEEEFLPVGGLFLPLGIARTTRYETIARRVEFAADSRAEEARARALSEARALMGEDCEELEASCEATLDGGFVRARAVIEAMCDIAAISGIIEYE